MTDHEVKLGKCRTAYLRHMHKNAWGHCCCYFALIVLSSLIVLRAYDPLYGENDISDPNAPAKIALDSVRFSRDIFDEKVSSSKNVETETDEFVFAYAWNDGRDEDIFTAENLQAFCEIESILLQQSNYGFHPNACDTETSNQTCVLATATGSITSFFYQQPSLAEFPFSYENCYLLNETKLGNFKQVQFYPLLNTPTTLVGFVNSRTKATRTRSVIQVSDATSDGLEDACTKAEKKYLQLFDMKKELFRSVYRDEATLGNINVLFVSNVLLGLEFDTLVPSDFSMIMGSIIFVAIWMRIYTGSTFLCVCCMSYIILSTTVAMFAYKILLRILFFDFIHILAVFLVLGIGADGVFVVIDAWKQSQQLLDNEFERLKYTYQRATATVFNTSFTTMFAFAVTGLSPLVPISTFGIYAALAIGTNFLFVCTIIPATVLVWERTFIKTKYHEKKTVDPNGRKEKSLENLVDGNNKYFEKIYYPIMIAHKRKVTMIGLGIGLLGLYGLTNVSQLTKPEQFLPEDHMFSKYLDVVADEFLSGKADENTLITVFWGIEGIQRDIFSHYTGNRDEYKDKILFDTAFNPADPVAQQSMIELCSTLEAASCNKKDCFGFDTLLLPDASTVKCTMKDFADWWSLKFANETVSTLTNNTNETLFYERIRDFAEENPPYQQLIGFIGGELKFFAHEFRLTLPTLSIGPEKEFYEQKLNKIMAAYEASAPDSASLVDYASVEMVQLAVEKALVQTVTRGLLITFPVVFLVMIFATRNWILAILSVSSIFFIVMTVLGFVFTVLEWELGITESIVAIMIVGLAVDYCVHLGHVYTLAGEVEGFTSRIDRFHYAVLTMGPTVLAGGATTLGAGLFLFGCQITFFTKMGVLLTLTVCSSLFFSLFFLMGASAWFGPEGKTCNFPKFSLCNRFSPNQNNESDRDLDIKALKLESHVDVGDNLELDINADGESNNSNMPKPRTWTIPSI